MGVGQLGSGGGQLTCSSRGRDTGYVCAHAGLLQLRSCAPLLKPDTTHGRHHHLSINPPETILHSYPSFYFPVFFFPSLLVLPITTALLIMFQVACICPSAWLHSTSIFKSLPTFKHSVYLKFFFHNSWFTYHFAHASRIPTSHLNCGYIRTSAFRTACSRFTL